jgi:hypothetical protein
MQRLKIALPDDLRARLDAASARSGQSIAEEIRSRVEASFARDAADKPTRDFLEGLALMPAEIARELNAAWHEHAGAHEALRQAILSRLKVLRPEGQTAFGDRPHATTSEDDPNKLGARIELRLRRQPDFTNSPTRRLMEEEYQRMGSPRALLDSPQQQRKPDQPKKRGK